MCRIGIRLMVPRAGVKEKWELTVNGKGSYFQDNVSTFHRDTCITVNILKKNTELYTLNG